MSAEAEAAIDRMKADLSVSMDRDLALALEIDPSTISSWRRRGAVPKKYLAKAARLRDEKVGANAGLRGVISPPGWHGLVQGYVFALVGISAQMLSTTGLLKPNDDENEIWVGFRLRALCEHFERQFRDLPKDSRDALRLKYAELKKKIESEDIEFFIESIR